MDCRKDNKIIVEEVFGTKDSEERKKALQGLLVKIIKVRETTWQNYRR